MAEYDLDRVVTPVPSDSNNWRMADRLSSVFIDRISIGTDPVDLKYGVDIKEVNLFVETGSGDVTISGALDAACRDLTTTASVDNGDGTVTVTTVINHGFSAADTVTIQGRTADSLEGSYVLQTGTATDELVLLADWTVNLTTDEGVDNEDGTVTLKTDGDHHFAVGAYVTIAGRTDDAYAGSYTTEAGTADDEIVITETYVDESAGVAVGGSVVGVYDESAGVAAGGDVIGPCTSGVLEAGDSIRLPVVAKRRTTIATVVSASTSTITMIGGR